MKLKLDENLSRHLKEPLGNLGHDTTTVHDEGLLGSPDTEVARAAAAEERMIFTMDLEFADLRKYPPGDHPGVVLFRPGRMGPLFANRFILDFVGENPLEAFERCVVVVDPARIRVRRPTLDTTGPEWEAAEPS